MKAFTSILLFIVMALPLPLTYAIYYTQLLQNHKEVHTQILRSIPHERLVHIVSTPASRQQLEFSWWESNELRYQGKMYDVVSSDTLGDAIHYYCYDDSKETGLNNSLSAIIDRNSHSQPVKKGAKHIFQVLQLMYVLPERENVYLPVCKVHSYSSEGYFLTASVYHIDSPPPEELLHLA